MARTTRNKPLYVWYSKSRMKLTYIGLWNAGYKEPFNDPESWNIDPRCSLHNDRDGRGHSLLYSDHIKSPGWDRDFYNGIVTRRMCKRSNRRWQRRQIRGIVYEHLEK